MNNNNPEFRTIEEVEVQFSTLGGKDSILSEFTTKDKAEALATNLRAQGYATEIFQDEDGPNGANHSVQARR